MLLLKTGAILALILTIPMAAYQGWLFVAPGLLSQERRVLAWTLAALVVLFPLGASFAYAMSRIMLTVLIGFSATIPGLEPSLVAGKGISFILTMMVAFGLVFEFPLILVLLSRLGVIDGEFLVRWRRTAIVLLSILAAVATPSPDPFSMLAMFIPLVLLYELSVFAILRMKPVSRGKIGGALWKKSY
jgi:sec-independent protein translocase protein TatC